MALRNYFMLIMFGLAMRVTAQESKIPLLHALELSKADSTELVHAFLKGNTDEIARFVQSNGGVYKYDYKQYCAVAMPVSVFSMIESAEFITAVHFELGEGQPLLNTSLSTTQVNSVHDGLGGLPDSYTGSGVIVGVIDAGIELQHPDFKREDGNTRIIEIWDQTMAYDSNRTPSYGYGQLWDSADINSGQCPHEDQGIFYGHGTNTAGIAAGNGASVEDFTGVAPESELIIVSSDFAAIGWTSTIADAVDYIFEKAEELGKPCVINASLGTYIGTHDATDVPTQFIESKIDAVSGRLMVCAAGNAGSEDPFHLGYEAQGDTHFTWLELPQNANPGYSFGFELFGDSNEFERVQFSIGADRVSPFYSFRGETMFDSVLNRMNFVYTDSLISPSGNFLCEVKTYAYIVNDVYRLQILLDNIDSTEFNYRLTIAGFGGFDTWAAQWLGYGDMVSQGLPSTTEYQAIEDYKLPDLNQSIVSAWACSDKVITVGNAINRNQYTDVDQETVILSGQVQGAISLTSSRCPSRNGLTKPETVAPGDNTLTAGAYFQLNALLANPSTRHRVAFGGLHNRSGGTSSASPVVAGIGALFLEKCPQGNWDDFKEAIQETSYADQFTGVLPNHQWGMGKVDALNLMKFTTPRPNVEAPSSDFCAGDTLAIALDNSYPYVLWNTGDTAANLQINMSGLYSASVTDERGCEGFSDTMSVFERPIPDKPVISSTLESPVCSGETAELSLDKEFGAYEWSSGEFTNVILVNQAGYYFCVVKNAFGCSNVSDTLMIDFHAASPEPVLQLQEDGMLFAQLDSGLASTFYWFKDDQEIGETVEPHWDAVETGIYQVEYADSNECVIKSNELLVYALGVQYTENADFNIWPNPFSDELHLVAERDIHSWRLTNSLGQLLVSDDVLTRQVKINVESLVAGVYTMEMKVEGQIAREKLIKW
ncbi:MAG: S8 family serine peptidase [Flavobacteriales bacterium]|nr:S8 family serine peptidase [Flavobacteriales bacterium]MBT5977229.1 S8 family serine peptidase [Flavobacteriales bacterium]MBT6383623.1 S8 family serine peptidase [Flavobacteriales bacterium]MBT6916351.1 S8 family serine peptidase [Flavobacteriales bacterium]MBT6979132.1 S8 family serine peptidase [Flavobacteriales bacterium]